MLPVAELLSVGREPLERSIWANLRVGKSSSVTEPFHSRLHFVHSSCQQNKHQRKQTRTLKPVDRSIMDWLQFIFNVRWQRKAIEARGAASNTIK